MAVTDPSGTRGFMGIPVDTPPSLIKTRQLEDRLEAVESKLRRVVLEPTPIEASVALGTGWVNYGSGFDTFRAWRLHGLVYLTGLVARTSGTNIVIANLPVLYRPKSSTASLVFGVATSSGAGRVDVNPNGDLVYQSGGLAYLSLSGIVFPAA